MAHELSLMRCGGLSGKEVRRGVGICMCVCMADSFCCAVETNNLVEPLLSKKKKKLIKQMKPKANYWKYIHIYIYKIYIYINMHTYINKYLFITYIMYLYVYCILLYIVIIIIRTIIIYYI